MQRRHSSVWVVLLAAGWLAGCPDATKPPVAVIAESGGGAPAVPAGDGGADAAAGGGGAADGACVELTGPIEGRVGQPLGIDGSCSSDPQGLPLTYAWGIVDQPADSTATLLNPASVTPTFVPDVPGRYVLRLVVSNGKLTSDPFDLTVNVGDCGVRPPSATVAADPASPRTGEPVRLVPTVEDADTADDCGAHAAVFDYRWELLSAPAGAEVALSDARAREPWFVPPVRGDYAFRLTVADPTGRSVTTDITVTVGDCGDNAPSVDGIAADPTESPAVGQTVRLTATVTDADADAACGAHPPVFRYQWRIADRPAGSSAGFNDPAAAAPSFTPDVPGDYEVVVMVTDPTGRVGRGAFTVTASECGANAPTLTVEARPPATNPGEPVQLVATADDADNDAACGLSQAVEVRWRLVEVPAGQLGGIVPPVADRASFTPDVPGDFVVEAVAVDETGRTSEPARLTLAVADCGLARPVARFEFYDARDGRWRPCDPGGTLAIDAANRRQVEMRATGSFDPDNVGACRLNQELSYEWRVVEFPAGRDAARDINVTLANSYQSALETQVDGRYRVQLVVEDETGRRSTPATCTLEIRNVRN